MYIVPIKATSFICLCLCKFEKSEQISLKPDDGEFYETVRLFQFLEYVTRRPSCVCLNILSITP